MYILFGLKKTVQTNAWNKTNYEGDSSMCNNSNLFFRN